MKRPQFYLIGIIVGLSLLLSSCAPGIRVTGTPGVTLSDKTVYVAYGSHVDAINVETGNIEWSYPQEKKNNSMFYAPPLVAGDFLYFGDLTNNFHKIDKKSGEHVWTFTGANGHYIGKANELNDVVYAPNNNGKLYAIDANDGSLKWEFKTGHYIWAQPQISENAIYVASMDHYVYALSKDGKQLWSTKMIGAVVATPVLSKDGSTLFVSSIGHEIAAVDTANGDIKWSFDSGDSIWGKAVIESEKLYFGNSSGTVFALDVDTGAPEWQQEISGSIVGGVSAIPDGIVIATEQGTLKALNYAGSPKWETNVTGKVFQAPVVNDQQLIIGAIESDHLLYAFDRAGTQIWSKTPEK